MGIKKVSAGFPLGRVAYFVTSNVHKFQEARSILSEYGIAAAKLKVEATEIQDDSLAWRMLVCLLRR